MHKTLTTIDQLIDALGGPTAVGDWLGIGQSAVSNWKLREEIPPAWHLRLYLEAQARGYSVWDDLFGVKIPQPAKAPPKISVTRAKANNGKSSSKKKAHERATAA